jgi:hypothetical protein
MSIRAIGVMAGALAALCGPSLAAAASSAFVVPQKDLSSPDAAIAQMARGVAANDAKGAIEAFAINDAAEGSTSIATSGGC